MSKQARLFAADPGSASPLAHRMRPRELADFLGQEHLLGSGKPLREAIERGRIASLVLWGPPGSGKTTLAELIAEHTDAAFEVFSAVTEGVPRVREILGQARERLESEGRGTILFCDEIHRFNKAQQDAFLHAVEQGIVTLIGATTENPSFELNSALLSRVQVYVLEPLGPEHIREIVTRASSRLAAEHGAPDATALADDAIELLVEHAGGDARRALNMCEIACAHAFERAERERPLSAAELGDVLQRRIARYDKSGEQHYNLISALHKSVRGSDVEGALYWLARMIDGGEDPNYLLRRIVRMASEDIGLSDPRALSVALAAKESYLFLGSPEGELAIAEAVVYLAAAPKSNRVYTAWQRAQAAAAEHPSEEVPLHLRNAPTGLMKRLGYGREYRYDHAEDAAFAAEQTYLPPSLEGARWYEPTDSGFEKAVRERLAWWAERRAAASGDRRS